MRKLTTNEFIERAQQIHGDKYDYSLSDYTTSIAKINIICKKHGTFLQTSNMHLQGQGCPLCSNNVKLTGEIFINRSKEKHGNKYDYSLVDYINQYEKVDIICSIHGIFNQTAKNHMNGFGCPKCANNIIKSNETFINDSITIHGLRYDYSKTNYKGDNKKVDIICNIHGVFKQIANSHINGSGCPKCGSIKGADILRSNLDEFISKAKNIHGDLYDYNKLIYNNSHELIKIKCKIHGYFEQKPYSHLNGRGCPICRESRGEKLIRLYLINNKISFIKEYKFNECKNKRKLPFDFYLVNKNICIEYDGKHHFEPIKRFGGLNGFLSVKENDKIKTDFCLNNNIKLIRIAYIDIYKINDILKNELNE